MFSHDEESFFVLGEDDAEHQPTAFDGGQGLDATSLVDLGDGVVGEGRVDGAIVSHSYVLREPQLFLVANDRRVCEVTPVDALTECWIIWRQVERFGSELSEVDGPLVPLPD